MSVSSCLRIDDAASYVLWAMTDEDAEAYRYHLGDCDACHVKVEELEFVSHALLRGVPQLTAPPQIKDRVMSVVRSEAQLLQAAGAGADRPAHSSSSRRFGRFAFRPLGAVVMACALIALGLGTGAVLEGGSSGGTTRTIRASIDQLQAPHGKAEMKVVPGRGAQLVVAGLPVPPKGRIYQVWLDHPKDRQPPLPTDAFFSVNKRGTGSVDVPGSLTGVSKVLVTTEPMGGSEIPSGQPVITVSTAT